MLDRACGTAGALVPRPLSNAAMLVLYPVALGFSSHCLLFRLLHERFKR